MDATGEPDIFIPPIIKKNKKKSDDSSDEEEESAMDEEKPKKASTKKSTGRFFDKEKVTLINYYSHYLERYFKDFSFTLGI